MTRLIDADALAEQYTEMVVRLLLNRGSIVSSYVTTLIVNAPTIDAVEVVRCGNCKRRKKNKFCLEHNRYEKNDTGYCSYGERRTQ